jgi:hypothetical protein
MLEKSDYVLAYIRTQSNIADQFTKVVDPVSFRWLRDWIASGLDENWNGEVVETLENLFQLRKMREMKERKAEQREQLKTGCKKQPRAELDNRKKKRREVTSLTRLRARSGLVRS